MVNKVILVGNLGDDPEIRHLETGAVVANFSLATNESYKDKAGNRQTITEWHRIELWEGLAKVAEQYLKKGQTVYIEGKIKTENYTDKEGISRYSTKIRANTMTMLGGGSGNSNAGSSTAADVTKPKVEASQTSTNSGSSDIDDLPF